MVKITRHGALLLLSVASFAPQALAHSLKELEESLMANEKYFQPADGKAADFTLQDADGHVVSLKDLKGKVVVLHFIYTIALTLARFMPRRSPKFRRW